MTSPIPYRTRGERVCAFIEKYCVVPQGDHQGKALVLEEFQRKFILEVYDNPFGTRRAILSIAKKNGKTGLIAGILLAHIAGPEAVQNAQIVSGAMSKDQAAVVFELAAQMVKANETLSRLVSIKASLKHLVGLAKNVTYKALSAEGKTKHGISPLVVILDELGQVEGPRSEFVSALTTSQDAYSNPLLLVISTQAARDTDMLSMWIDSQLNAPDPRVVLHLYSAKDPECALDDKTAWYAANPALGRFKSLPGMEANAKNAIEMPANENEFRNFHLNQRVETAAAFIPKSTWMRNKEAPKEAKRRKVWGGLDLSSVSDLTALVLTDEDGGVHPTFWLPEDGLLEKSKKDKVPYDLWKKQGFLQTTPGKAIKYEHVARFLRGVFDNHDVQKIAFDRYNLRFLVPYLEAENFSEAEISKFEEFGQGTQSMTPALRELEVRLTNGEMKHGSHPILNMCCANVVVVGDSGARKFDKDKARGRIDGMVALAMAVGVMPMKEEKKGGTVADWLAA